MTKNQQILLKKRVGMAKETSLIYLVNSNLFYKEKYSLFSVFAKSELKIPKCKFGEQKSSNITEESCWHG